MNKGAVILAVGGVIASAMQAAGLLRPSGWVMLAANALVILHWFLFFPRKGKV